MSNRLIPFELHSTSGTLTDSNQIRIDASGFDGNLENTDTNLQLVAQKLDDLTIAGMSGHPVVSGLHVDIAPRVDLNTDLSGNYIFRFRVYDNAAITSMSLFIEQGGLFSTVAMATPSSDGDQSQTLSLPSIVTSSERTIIFYIVINNRYISSSYVVRVEDLDAEDVKVDTSSLTNVQGDDAQDMAGELDRLFGIVASGQPGAPSPRFQGPFVPFTASVNIGASNFDIYTGNTALYARSDNARVNFILPTDAEITAEGVASDEQVEYAVLNQAGTGRFDSGLSPTNTVIIDVDGANNIRRNTADGTLLNFIEAHQNDLVTLTQSARGEPWVAVRVTLSSAALLLPSGLFRLQAGVTLRPVESLGFLVGLPAGTTPQVGDAYLIQGSNENFGGYGIQDGDVLVSLVDNPSRQLLETNDDWIVIRNATNDIISLSEINFLNTVSETDSFEDDRLMARSDVTDVRVFLSTGVLDHAPFITPSTDSDNPQASNGARYVGGDEDISAGNEFHLTDFTKVGEPAGSSRFPNALMYFDIDGSFDTVNLLDQVYVVIKDAQGEEVSRHNAVDHFRPITLTGSTDTYYVFDRVGASDNYSSINYLSGYTIDVVFRRTLRHFELSSEVNALPAIADDSIPIEKLEPNIQALITADHSLTDAQETKLDGLETTGVATPWTAGDLYVRDTNASPTSDLGHYYNVGQQNGILSNFDHTRAVTFVVPNFVTVTQLQRTDDTSIKHPVTRIGAITIQDNTHNPPRTFNGQGYTATLPASSFNINNPVGDIWQVDGTASNLELSGAANSFKVHVANLGQDVLDRTAPTPVVVPSSLPENLRRLSQHLNVETTDLGVAWREVDPSPIRSRLTRLVAGLWAEDRNDFTGNVFDDIDGVEFLGFQNNNIFYYSDPNHEYNTSFPGAQSYILNAPVRIRNASGETTIPNTSNILYSFDYALSAPLEETVNQPMVRLGSTSATPLMGISGEEGLYLNIGRQDGGQRSRTYQSALQVIGGHWHDEVDETETAEAEIIIPDSLSGSLTVTVAIQLDNNGNDEGTHTETLTITDLNSDQNLGSRDFTYTNIDGVGDNDTRTVNFEYDAVNNDLSSPRRVLFLRPPQPFTNASLTYNVAASRSITETWNVPTSYAEYPVNAGSGHDDYGIFDPHLYNTEHVHERNRIVMILQPYRAGDTDPDPEMAVKIIVDGEYEGSSSNGYLIRLHRPQSDFTFNDVRFGNNACAISHIQMYNYDVDLVPTEQELLTLYQNQDNWFGAFTDRDETELSITIDGLDCRSCEFGHGDNTQNALPTNLRVLSEDISISTRETTDWVELTNPYPHDISRLAAALWDENRRTFGSENYFEDRDDVEVVGFTASNVRYFADPNDDQNTSWHGKASYVYDDDVRIKNKDTNSGLTTIPDTHTKIIAFDYQLESLPSSGQLNILKLGESNEPLLAVDSNGLVARIGNQDGTEVSQSRTRILRTNDGAANEHLGRIGNVDSSEDANFILPATNLAQFPLTVNIRLEIFNNGISQGSDTQTYVITDEGVDQAASNLTWTISGQPNFVGATSYDHDSILYGANNPLQIITVSPNALFTDNNIVYSFSMTYTETVTFRRSLTYTDHAIKAGLTGSLRGSTTFPPSQYPTDQVHHDNSMLLTFFPTDGGNFENDPPLTLAIVVDGEIQDAIPLHRTASELSFDDMTFGNGQTDVANIQVYEYDLGVNQLNRLTDQVLLNMYAARDRWLGVFRNPNQTTDTISLDANFEVLNLSGIDRGLVLTSENGTKYLIQINNDGSLTTKTL